MRMREIINIIEAKLTEARFPSLRPALLINGELFIGKLNDTHNRVRNDLSDEMRNILDDESWEETRGFVDSNDRWMNGRQAVRYAEKHDLIDPLYAGQHIDFLVSEYVKKQ